VLNLAVCLAYVKRLFENAKVVRFLSGNHRETSAPWKRWPRRRRCDRMRTLMPVVPRCCADATRFGMIPRFIPVAPRRKAEAGAQGVFKRIQGPQGVGGCQLQTGRAPATERTSASAASPPRLLWNLPVSGLVNASPTLHLGSEITSGVTSCTWT
jgi:hypothetical protein